MWFLGDVKKNIDIDDFDDVWKKLKRRAHDAY